MLGVAFQVLRSRLKTQPWNGNPERHHEAIRKGKSDDITVVRLAGIQNFA